MKAVVSPEWKKLGATSNAEVYEMRDDVIVIVPHADTKDDETTARESLAFQRDHWSRVGRRGAVIVYMDPVIEQDSGARAVYANETKGVPTTCYALVSESLFAQMSASVFEGLAKPAIPTRIFPSFEEALRWVAEMNAAGGVP